jgi:hypothetical protein
LSGISPEKLVSNRGGQPEVSTLKALKGITKLEQSPLCRLLQDRQSSDDMEMASRSLSPPSDFVHEQGVNAGLSRKLNCLALTKIKVV